MFIEKIGTILSSPQRVVSSVFALVIVLAIPLTVLMVNQQQDLRQRAAETQGIGVIAGVIWEDKNGNGVKDAEDTGFQPSNTKVKLSRPSKPDADRLAIPGVHGRYDFNIFNQVSFVLSLEGLPPGYRVTKSPNNGAAFDFPVAPGGGINFDFLVKPPVTIQPSPNETFKVSGRVYRDPNRNGIHDTGEPGFSTVVNIRKKDGTILASPQTNNDLGTYSLSNLPAGDYRVQAVIPVGYNATSLNPVPFSLGPDKAINVGIAPTPTPTPTPTKAPTTTPTKTPTPTPTKVLTPTPTTIPQPGDVLVNFAFKLPGIPDTDTEPTRQTRQTMVYVFNNNQEITSVTTNATYQNGSYIGSVNLGKISPGSYTIKIKIENSLRKNIPGVINLSSGTNDLTSQNITLVTGDIDGNNLINITDYNLVLDCYASQAKTATCTLADLNDDGTVDAGRDLNILFRAFDTINGD